jgi:copper chaperone CopZ
MIRRHFIQGIACSLGVGHAGGGTKTKTVTYHIRGFTCVTCAVGLDTLLREEKGIVRSRSSYPDRTSTIEFHPDLIQDEQIRARIQEFGFKASYYSK